MNMQASPDDAGDPGLEFSDHGLGLIFDAESAPDEVGAEEVGGDGTNNEEENDEYRDCELEAVPNTNQLELFFSNASEEVKKKCLYNFLCALAGDEIWTNMSHENK